MGGSGDDSLSSWDWSDLEGGDGNDTLGADHSDVNGGNGNDVLEGYESRACLQTQFCE